MMQMAELIHSTPNLCTDNSFNTFGVIAARVLKMTSSSVTQGTSETLLNEAPVCSFHLTQVGCFRHTKPAPHYTLTNRPVHRKTLLLKPASMNQHKN